MKDLFCVNRYTSPNRYDANKIEIDDDIVEEILQQIDMVLFTEPCELVGCPGFGINLRKYLFDTNFPINDIKTKLDEQFRRYVNPLKLGNISVTSNITLHKSNACNFAVIDIYVDGSKVSSYIV